MRRSAFKVVACLAFCLTPVLAMNAFAGKRGVEEGACCFGDGSCQDLTAVACLDLGGEFQGEGTICQQARGTVVICEATGACCFGLNQCVADTTQGYCESELQGTWAGQGTFCAKPRRHELNSFTTVNNPVNAGGAVFCFAPLNDDCIDAIEIDSLGDPVYGSNQGSTEDIIPDCELFDRGFDKFGVWYKVTGNGSVLRASVCGLFDPGREPEMPRSVLFVYCGGCENPQCVAGDGGILQSCADRSLNPVEWCSVVGEEYLILVALEGEATNDFMLLVEDTGTPCEGLPCVVENDECEGAITITTGFPVGNTYNATPSNAPSCTINKPLGSNDVWYRINGVGGPMFAEICAQFPGKGGQFAELHLYCGQCDNLNCLDGAFGMVPICADLQRGDGVRVDWCSDDETYFLRVVWPSNQGEFLLHVDTTEGKCVPEPCGERDNDFCEDAEPICPGILYTGDTFNATNDYLDHGAPISTVFFCGALMALYDNWYSYTPIESGLLFVHVEQLPTEWVFGVYDDCPEFGGNLLKCNITRHHGVIVVPVNAYHTYYVRIAGFLESRGTYIMDILGPPCANLPPNNSGVGVQ